jgi:hypothetical protein
VQVGNNSVQGFSFSINNSLLIDCGCVGPSCHTSVRHDVELRSVLAPIETTASSIVIGSPGLSRLWVHVSKT